MCPLPSIVDPRNDLGKPTAAPWKHIAILLGVCSVGLLTSTIALAMNQHTPDTEETHFVWTKAGLEALSFDDWKLFEDNDSSSLYIQNLPFPGDNFTQEHAWALSKSSSMGDMVLSMDALVKLGYLRDYHDALPANELKAVASIPTLFSDPIIMEESLIDYRLQLAADIGSNAIGESAAKGRLVNPAGRRLREHFYRFPDQCDATPIALEVFLRLMIYDQIEAFFHDTKIGLWHDLFPQVDRSEYNSEELSVARWYGERYAESYVHKITNGWVYPLGSMQNIDTYMLAVGLDPFDATMDPATPTGLGNLIGKTVTDWVAANDGLQKDNDFVDIDGLERIASFHSNQSWYNWKPSFAGSNRFQGIRNGIVTQQTFVSPSLGIFSFLYENEQDFINLGLQDAVPELDMSEEAYIKRSKVFLEIQKNITDYEKAVAELSNNKISGSVFLILAYVPLLKELASAEEYPRLYDEFSMVTSGCAEYAATHAAWRHKRTYLAGRPKTIVRHLGQKNPEFASKYPEAAIFEPLIPAGDHPEYPSGSSAIYSAFAQSADEWFLDKFGLENASSNTGPLTFTVPARKFYWSNGPSKDITLEYEHLHEWIEELPISRVYGGVHFLEAGHAGLSLGRKVGSACTRLLHRLNDGDFGATYPNPSRKSINAFNPPNSPAE